MNLDILLFKDFTGRKSVANFVADRAFVVVER